MIYVFILHKCGSENRTIFMWKYVYVLGGGRSYFSADKGKLKKKKKKNHSRHVKHLIKFKSDTRNFSLSRQNFVVYIKLHTSNNYSFELTRNVEFNDQSDSKWENRSNVGNDF